MNRLEMRVTRLEEVGLHDDNEGLSGVIRILLDENGNEIERVCLPDPVEPLHIPAPPDPSLIDPDAPTSQGPILTSYKDEPWQTTGQQLKGLMKAISGKSRTI
jgi:hypothetical protein